MIARLTGRIGGAGADRVIVDVGGVGYLVFCSARTLAGLPGEGEASLHIETHVREDHIHLYGFLEPSERDWFNLLRGVQGVGARLALAILSALAPVELMQAIAAGEKTMLTRAPGVGAKLAARLITELKDKVAGLSLGLAAALDGGAAAPLGPESDAVSALVNLGYRPAEAASAVRDASRKFGEEEVNLESLIRGGLEELVS